MNLFIATLAVLLPWTAGNYETANCGQLKEQQVFNERPIAALGEFPWIARVYFKRVEPRLAADPPTLECLATLITKRHLIAAAVCFSDLTSQSVRVLLGDSNKGNANNEPDCDANDNCAPAPKAYRISHIAIHPNYDSKLWDNDIAVVQLTRDVRLSAYTQPICLPPPNIYNADFQGQYFVTAGFLEDPEDGLEHEMVKLVTHVMPRGYCTAQHSAYIPEDYICTSTNTNLTLYSGSPLMGFDAEYRELRRYYLLATLSSDFYSKENRGSVYVPIARHINWILSNVRATIRRHSPK